MWVLLPSTRMTTRLPEIRSAGHKFLGAKSPEKKVKLIWAEWIGSGLDVGFGSESGVSFGSGSGVGFGFRV